MGRRFRIFDGAMPGYQRAAADEARTQNANSQSVGSPVLSQAYAETYRGYVPPTMSRPSYSRWRIVAAASTIQGGAVCNEIELWSGADGSGTKFTPQSASSTNNYNPAALINGLTAENQSADMDYLYSALGSYYQVNLAVPQPVASIRFFQFLDVPESSWYRKYYIDTVHIEASNDGSTWDRIASSVDLTSPRNAMKVINL